MSSVFLSHSHVDKETARRIAVDLRRSGHAVWFDEAEMRVGDSLIERLGDGLEDVDYVAVLISRASLKSEWVKREIQVALSREVVEKRAVVLPLLLERVELTGFIRDKFCADFTDDAFYGTALKCLLDALGPATALPTASEDELEILREQLEQARAMIDAQGAELDAHRRVGLRGKSPTLREAIEEDGERHPQYAAINLTHAFEVGDFPVTLGYLLWSIGKAQRRGGHPLSMLISMENKWPAVEAMLSAYAEVFEDTGSDSGDASTD